MKYYNIILVCITFLVSCQNNDSKKEINQKSEIQFEIEDFNQFLYRKADMLPKVHIDSISISKGSYNIYITDTLLNYINQVNIIQNINIILRDFCCFSFEDIPFNRINVVYQVPYRDSSGYFEVYNGTVKETKHRLRMFSNLSFSNVTKEIVLAHQGFPKINVLSSLNMSLALVVAEEDKTKLEWFGIDCMSLIIGYLLECETKKENYYKKKLDSVLKSFIGKKDSNNRATKKSIAERIKKTLEQECKTLEKIPARHVEEKRISL